MLTFYSCGKTDSSSNNPATLPAENEESSEGLNLTNAESSTLRNLVIQLRVCTFRTDSEIIVETDTNGMSLIGINGQNEYANKELSGQNGEIYLCRGKAAFYNYVRNLIRSRGETHDCPANAISAFFVMP